MIVQRQISALLKIGRGGSSSEDEKLWAFQDVEARYKLVVANGKITGGTFVIPASSTITAQLPLNYDAANVLVCLFTVYGNATITLTRVDTTTAKWLVQGTGTLPGVTMTSDRVTSVAVLNASSSDPILVQYSFFEQPNLTYADSFQGGAMTYGEVTNHGG